MQVDKICVALYRCSYFFYNNKLKLIANIFRLLNVIIFSCHISPKAKLGKGIKLAHPTGIVIGDGVEVGDNCLIAQNVTLGVKNFYRNEYPKIGDNVVICANAVVLGDISVGNNVIIGANSTVIFDVPNNKVAIGSPARFKESAL
ncbi:serine O-acetyltransferase [Vibrio alginolyticus]|uniref:serine O-acetyltransferase n=3 Tax=Vibrio alginolyticus TaxID=663 RepID=UPI001BD39A81|nr:serine acetyltransferase [Vibrio alginolyticus]EJG0027407.1 serine acetyltransferase [Vibrio alginolyticus]EMA2429696.1 serine acetyltransferase [Vibrio alginolyticus]MBT0095456.1 serine acetyltransferase [Vibrio alginolyticus]HCZ9284562.1 serine acetyltransferase [Vibrio alginolyticus]